MVLCTGFGLLSVISDLPEPLPAVECACRETLLPAGWRSKQGCRSACATCVLLLMHAAWALLSLTGQ